MMFFSIPFLAIACGAVVWILYRAVRLFVSGAAEDGIREVGRAALVAAAYAVILLAVSFAAGKDIRKAGDTVCFSAWCATLTDFNLYDKELAAKLRLRNSSADRAAAPGKVTIMATDGRGRTFVGGPMAGDLPSELAP